MMASLEPAMQFSLTLVAAGIRNRKVSLAARARDGE